MRSDYIQAYINRGDILIRLNRTQEAQKVYEKALQFDDGNPDIYYNLGVVYLEQRKMDQALYYFEKALKINPEHEQALLNSAILIQESGSRNLRKVAYDRDVLGGKEPPGQSPEEFFASNLSFPFEMCHYSKKNRFMHASLTSNSRKEKASISCEIHEQSGKESTKESTFNLGMLAMDEKHHFGREMVSKAVQISEDFRSALFSTWPYSSPRPGDLWKPYLFCTDFSRHHPDHVKGLILLGDIYINTIRDLMQRKR
ncbi:protein O-mannosyl-transferase TMTC3 [Caerostris extrusa]|uniref:Protein O-mannosyl-transferase TMTC3 n=1 Tax=Caerostris extrusa TaxID=172846 RepID=A0AAV4MA62_CAEEX|nr:protein O-mannosyl-transferase TMTC3 [Caerostris extrusa]